MIVELNLAQAEEILTSLAKIEKPSDNITSVKSAIKLRIKQETELQVEEINRLIQRISDNGFKDETMLSNFNSAKSSIQTASETTKNKYFDGDGKEK
tara:strand:+ start:710 stop:1000 length:291 start_codon:yes stop_codon:yes gene_type:complete